MGGFGGFAAGVELPPGYRRPVLMMTTDGVGTKLDLARRARRWEGVGFDLVAMVADDLAAVGASPLGIVDYLAVGALDPARDAIIVQSIAEACHQAGCPLLGGETAEHPGVMAPDQVDLAASALGVVEHDRMLGPERVGAGDMVIGLASPNLRSNGFSLVRAVLDRLSHPQGQEALLDLLLAPSVIYSPAVLAAIAGGQVHAAAHVTGGGLEANLGRVVPAGLVAEIDWVSWTSPAIFELIAERGGISTPEMRSAFNMGIGFCLIAPGPAVPAIAAAVGHDARVIGRLVPG
jgi:phosphoribosylformylglycinamidine cyclo-ligase